MNDTSMKDHLTDEEFRTLKVGDVVQHNVSNAMYAVSSVAPPFFPRFRKVKAGGTLAKEVRSFLPMHLMRPVP